MFFEIVVLCLLSCGIGFLISRRYAVVKQEVETVVQWYIPYALLNLIPGAKLHDAGGIIIPIGDEKYHITDDNIYQIITVAGVEDEVEADPNRVFAYAEKVAASKKHQPQPEQPKKKHKQKANANNHNGNGKNGQLPSSCAPLNKGIIGRKNQRPVIGWNYPCN